MSEKSSQAAVDRVDPERSLQLARAAAQVAVDHGAENVVIMDLSDHSANFDYFVIGTGRSQRQLRALADEIDDKLEKELHDKRIHIDGADTSQWVVLDYGTVLVHLFDETTRMFYGLEALWADCPRIPWQTA